MALTIPNLLFIFLCSALTTLGIFLLPRFHRKRTISCGPFRISIVGPLRRRLLKALTGLTIAVCLILLMQEIYYQTVHCDVAVSHTASLFALSHFVAELLENAHIPYWADEITLSNVLRGTHEQASDTYAVFSTLWIDQTGLDLIRRLFHHQDVSLTTQWSASERILYISFPFSTSPYVKLIFWEKYISKEFSDGMRIQEQDQHVVNDITNILFHSDMSITANTDQQSPHPLLKTYNSEALYPYRHYYEVFPLVHVTWPESNRLLYEWSQKEEDVEDKKIITRLIPIPVSAHAIASREWGAHSNTYLQPHISRNTCLYNIQSLHFLPTTLSEQIKQLLHTFHIVV